MANKKAKGTMGSVPPPLATRSTRSRAKAVDPVDTESAGPAEDPARTNGIVSALRQAALWLIHHATNVPNSTPEAKTSYDKRVGTGQECCD